MLRPHAFARLLRSVWKVSSLAAVLVLLVTVSAQDALGVSLAPGTGATNVCTDAPLSITFDQQPTLGTSGVIAVYRADGTLADTIDLADPNTSRRTIGGATSGGAPINFRYFPVIVTGNTASIYLHHALEYGQTYYVTLDPGVLGADGFGGISDAVSWRFTTRASPPSAGNSELTVAADGSGDFCSLQGAIDFVPVNNTRPVTITVRTGTYTEIVYVRSSKPFITVRGENRDQTVIQYTNNNNQNPSTASRPVFGVDAPDFTLENITVHNTTPLGGSQAEAFRGNNQRILLNRVNLLSFQDTLLLQGTGFVTNSYIEGDVDFTWGVGAVFFQANELRGTPRTTGYYTMVRNTQANHGNVYVGNRLTRAASTPDNSFYLGRIDPTAFPFSEAVYIDNAMDSHIRPVGWLLSTTPNNDCSKIQNVHFWEYDSVDLAGNPVDVSQRLACSRQLTEAEAAQYRDPAFVLNGWVPTTINATPSVSPPGPTPPPLAPGSAVTVNWTAPTRHTADALGLYRVGAADSTPLAVQFISAGTTGTASFVLPSAPGRYDFRYLVNGGARAVSNALAAGTTCDADASGTVDRSDIAAILSARGASVFPGDPRDADGDGQVTVLDARACVSLCTRAQCAP